MKKITQLTLITMTMLCLVQFAFAQNQSIINGVVTDIKGNPLTSASVLLFKTEGSLLIRGTVTEEKGRYAFKDLPGGLYYITISNIGFEQNQSKTILLGNSQKYFCDTTRLLTKQKQLDAVVVTSRKQNFIETKIDKTVLNIEQSPVAAGVSVFEVLEKSPGVYSDKNGNLSMQGKSGLQVLIDGRPTYMSNGDLTVLLKNMQSNEVQSIELITNPSSRYDASGNAGIIHIKTKKSKNYGTNGTLSLGTGYGKEPKANTGISLNNRSKKLNLFGNYNYSYNKNSRTLDIDRQVQKNGVTTYFGQEGIQFNESNTHRYKLGADYNISTNNVIGFLVNGTESYEYQHAVNNTLMSWKRDLTDSSLYADNNFNQSYRNNSYNLNFKSAFNEKGAELTIDADYSNYNSQVNSLFQNFYYTATKEKLKDPLLAKNNTSSVIAIKSFKADYSNPISASLKLETGAKVSMINSNNDLRYASLNGVDWQQDVSKSNHFIYDENVWSAYVNGAKEWKSTSLQFGLRAEFSDTRGNSTTDQKIVKRNYFDLFPSVFISHKLSAIQNIGFSYSRRIQRPDYESLNPFVYTIDEYTYQKGNPFLTPEYSHSFQLNYLFKNKYMAQVAYTAAKDVIADVILADTTNKALYQTSKNIDQQKIYRFTITTPFQIGNWWKVNNNFNGIEMSSKSPNLEGEQLNASQFFVILNSNHTFKINNDFTAELNGKYISPMLNGTLKLQSEFTMDAGLGKSVFNKKGTLKLGVTDILNTKNQKVSSVYPGVNYAVRQKYETRVFRLSFTYRFGNNNVKASRDKKIGLEEEQRRLKSGS
jgi:hypothetical protein